MPQPGAELFELQSQEITFHAGAVVIMFDPTMRTQRFFQGHDDLITSMAVHPFKVIVASGQRGKKNSTICIWDSGAQPAVYDPTGASAAGDQTVAAPPKKKITELSRLLVPGQSGGIGSMDFNEKGELLAYVTCVGNGSSGSSLLQIWDWKNEVMMVSAKAHANPVSMCRFNPFQSHDADEVLEDNRCYTLVTAGLRHVKLWVLKKVEHPLDVEDRYKNRGKKVTKSFGGGGGKRTKEEQKEMKLRTKKTSNAAKRPMVWDVKGDVVETSSKKRRSNSGGGKKKKCEMILAMCFMPDGSGNGVCMTGSADGHIYMYDQLESSEELPDNVMLRKLNPSNHAKKLLRQKKKLLAVNNSASNDGSSNFVATDASNGVLTLNYVYGFKCDATQHVLHVVGNNAPANSDDRDCSFVFPAAGLGVVQDLDITDDTSNSKQSFLGNATPNACDILPALHRHTDDVLSLCVSEMDLSVVATGECGKRPSIIVWSIDGSEKKEHSVHSILVGFHERGVAHMAFGRRDPSLLASVGMDDSNSIALYNWKESKLLATLQGGKSLIHFILFHPYSGGFITCGDKNIQFWKISYGDDGGGGEKDGGSTAVANTNSNARDSNNGGDNGSSKSKQVNFGGKLGVKLGGTKLVKGEPKNKITCTLTSDKGKFGNVSASVTMRALGFLQPNGFGTSKVCHVVSGTDEGTLLTWDIQTHKCLKSLQAHHKDGAPSCAINSICSHTNGIVTGGNDGRILLWTHQLELMYEFELKRKHVDNFNALLPQITSISMPHANNTSKPSEHLLVATKSSEAYYIDLIRAKEQNIVKPVQVQQGNFGGRSEVWGLACHPLKPNIVVTCGDDRTVRSYDTNLRVVIGRTRVESRARCVGFSPDGEHIGIGLDTGMVEVWSDELDTLIRKFHHAREEISDLKYSPNGEIMACGSRDNYIYLYSVDGGRYNKNKVLKGHSSFCNHLDFSKDSLFLQSNDGAGERLCWSIASGKRSDMGKDSKWFTNTIVFGKLIDGARPPSADKSDLNCSCVSNGGWIVAIGDDDGMINTTKYPCPKVEDDSDSEADELNRIALKRYSGHASHVTNVRFNQDDSALFSVGGGDRILMEWKTNFKLNEDALKKKNRKKVKPLRWEPVGWVACVIKNPHDGKAVTALCHAGREASSNRPRFVSGGDDCTIRLWEQSEGGNGYGMPIQLLKIDLPKRSPLGSSIGGCNHSVVPQDIMDIMLSEKFCVGGSDGSLIEIDLHYDNNQAKASADAAAFQLEHRDELSSIFDALDVELKGTITAKHMLKQLTLDYDIRSKLESYSESLSNALKPKNVVKTLKALDANQDGSIDTNEFFLFAQEADSIWREKKLNQTSNKRRMKGMKRFKTILHGHGKKITSCATHPTRPMFATTGYDKTICIWDIELHCIVAKCGLSAPGVSLAFNKTGTLLACGLLNGIVIVFEVSQNSKNRGSLQTLNQCALVKQRSAGFGSPLALPGSKRKPTRREKKIQNKGDPQAKEFKPLVTKKFDADALCCLKFSPDSTKLAVGSRNSLIYFLKTTASNSEPPSPPLRTDQNQQQIGFIPYAIGKGHAAGLTKLDWSSDGTCIRSNADDKFCLYWNSKNGKQDRNALEKRDVAWDTSTCTIQWSTQGIWRPSTPEELMYVDHGSSTMERCLWEQKLRTYDEELKMKNSKKDHTTNRHASKKSNKKFLDAKRVKCCNTSNDGSLMVTADDRQRIALWRYPAVPGAKCRLFAGHGNQASDVQFGYGDKWVISVGGDDRSIIVWKHQLAPDAEEIAERKALSLEAGNQLKQLQDREKAETEQDQWALLDDGKDNRTPTKEEQWKKLDTPPDSPVKEEAKEQEEEEMIKGQKDEKLEAQEEEEVKNDELQVHVEEPKAEESAVDTPPESPVKEEPREQEEEVVKGQKDEKLESQEEEVKKDKLELQVESRESTSKEESQELELQAVEDEEYKVEVLNGGGGAAVAVVPSVEE